MESFRTHFERTEEDADEEGFEELYFRTYTVHLRFRNGFGLLMKKDAFCFLELKLCLVLVYDIKGFTSKTRKRRSLSEYRFLCLGVAC
jgi:hypothetical protein